MKKRTDLELETWVVGVGAFVIQQRTQRALKPVERLVYCVWAADYGMHNAGDLTPAADLYAAF